MQLTVVIPAYKAEETIARAIDSVLEQPNVDAEIIVVVDGVFDNTPEIAASYPEVKAIVCKENRGAQVARNLGLEMASSDYVVFLDSDDYIEGPLLSGLAGALEEASADLAFGPWVIEEDGGYRESVRRPGRLAGAEVLANWLRGEYVPSCSVAWNTDFLRRIGGWNVDIMKNQDGELAMRALMKGGKHAYTDQGLGIYWKHASPHRISTRSGYADINSQLAIAKQVGQWLDEQPRRNSGVELALGEFYYVQARKAYATDGDELGDHCLRMARVHGYSDHQGSRLHAMLARSLGLGAKEKLARALRGAVRRVKAG